MKPMIVFLITTFLPLVHQTLADDLLSGQEIAENIANRNEGVNRFAYMKMILKNKRGSVRERTVRTYRKYFGDEKRTVSIFDLPKSLSETGFLTYDYKDKNKDDDQWLYLPALKKIRKISASDRGDYFLGTDLTYDDIRNESKITLEDYTRKTIGIEKVNGHVCYKVENLPVDEKTKKELGYSKTVTWVDSSIWITRKAEFWDVRGNPLKVILTTDINKIQGVWTPHKIHVTNHKTGHQTIFLYSKVNYKKILPNKIFKKGALKRGIK